MSGPLDGRMVERRGKGPLYLTDEGEVMPTKAGDRIFSFRGAARADVRFTSGYIFRTDLSGSHRRYVHSSVAMDMTL